MDSKLTCSDCLLECRCNAKAKGTTAGVNEKCPRFEATPDLVNPEPPPKDGTRILATFKMTRLKWENPGDPRFKDYIQAVVSWSGSSPEKGHWRDDTGCLYLENACTLIHWEKTTDLDKIIEANEDKIGESE